MVEPIRFGMIGRRVAAEFFLRVARELPERFQVSGVFVRDEGKRRRLEEEWRVPGCDSVDQVLRSEPLFVVVSVPWAVCPPMLQELTDRGVPALAETPPAPDLEGLIDVTG